MLATTNTNGRGEVLTRLVPPVRNIHLTSFGHTGLTGVTSRTGLRRWL